MAKSKIKSPRKERAKDLSIEELERRIALSVPSQKKSPVPEPYPPGTRYGLLRKHNFSS